jgi:hypothetical protein
MIFGCAERAPEINTVQPNYVNKEMFDGEWYFQQTITHVAPENSLGFTGYEAGLEKIRWEITEDVLYALQSYEPIEGLNDSATREGAPDYAEGVVAAYPIISHFDIRRAYNSSTAEQSNVTQENTTDRPWRERDHMRIDWGGNLSSGPAGISFVLRGGAGRDFIRDHERFNPDHLIIDDDRIQVTAQATIADGGMTCFYVYGVNSCADSEVRVRTSIYRVKPEDQVGFEPMVYPDYMQLARLKDTEEMCPHSEYSPEFVQECEYVRATSFGFGQDSTSVSYACTPEFNELINAELVGYSGYLRDDSCGVSQIPVAARFGYFRTERFAYDRQLGGNHDSRRLFLANHHNIWINAERTRPRPIIYYTNPGYPEDLEEVTSKLGNEWDEPFKDAVILKADLSVDEVRSMLTADAEAQGVKPWMFLKGDRLRAGAMFQVRRNACSPQGIEDYLARFKNTKSLTDQLNAVIDEASDGEGLKLGNILRVCAGLRHFSRGANLEPTYDWQQLGDLRYSFVNWVHDPQARGPLGYGPSSADPETGRILKGNANVYGGAIDTYARSASDIVRAMNEDLALDALLSGSHYREWLESSPSVDLTTQMSALTFDSSNGDQQVMNFDTEAAYGSYRDQNGRVDTAALRKHLRRRLSHPTDHDPLHRMSNLPPVADRRLEALKQDPRIRARALSEDRLALLRPLYGLDVDDPLPAEVEDRAVDMLLDPSKALEFSEKRTKFFADQNMLMADFVDDSVIGLALELKGLDAEEVYRIIREETYRAVMLHEIGHTLGLTHNFSASFDALNFPERFWEIYEAHDDDESRFRDRITEYRYTSIMDYGSRFNSDIHGLGSYDKAAVRFVYSGEMQTEEYSDDVPPSLDYEILINGYESLPGLLGGDLSKLQQKTHRPLIDMAQDKLKGLISNSQVVVDNLDGALAAAGFASDAEPLEYEGLYYFDHSVPYNYCADFYNGNLQCKTWDEGASHFDVVSGAIQRYWNYYIFDHYRQGRSERSFLNSFSGREGRLGLYISYPFRFFYFYQNYDLNLRQDLYRAAVASLNFVSQVLGAPEPGKHCWDEERSLYRPARFLDAETEEACEDRLDVPLGVGRPFKHQFNGEYYYQIDAIGSFLSKYNLLFYLTDTSSQFFRIANIGDTRAFSIGYYRIYQEQLINLVSDLVFTWLDEGKVTYTQDGKRTGDSFNYVLRGDTFEPRAIAAANQLGQSDEDLESLDRVEAPISYDLAWFSVLLNAVFNTSTFDGRPDFIDYIVIMESGTGDDRNIEGRDVITFTHPHTGVVYRAAQTLDGQSIAYELLRRANLVLSEEWEPAQAALESDPEDQEAQMTFARAEKRVGRYQDFIQDLMMMRKLVDYYDD